MKRVVLRDHGQFKAREVMTTVVELPSPNSGVTVADMRKRNRILDAMEAQRGAYVDLEDADYSFFETLLNAFQFASAKPDLLRVLDDMLNAKAPEETPEPLRVVGSELATGTKRPTAKS